MVEHTNFVAPPTMMLKIAKILHSEHVRRSAIYEMDLQQNAMLLNYQRSKAEDKNIDQAPQRDLKFVPHTGTFVQSTNDGMKVAL